MRVALIHNPSAGAGELESVDLRRLFEAEGHKVQEFGKTKKQIRRAFKSESDVVAVAGGDGTVSRVLQRAFKKGVVAPICILSVGTANNIARTLDLQRPAAEVIQGLSAARRTRLDIGKIEAPWGNNMFVEATGLGFIGTMLSRPMSQLSLILSRVRGRVTGRPIEERRARGVARLIRDEPPRAIAITADGVDLTGNYIGVEAMNIREVGPNICLAPNADTADGLLDLVLVREEDREALARCVERQATHCDELPLVRRRVKRVEISWEPQYGHVDDGMWPKDGSTGTAAVSIGGCVTVLCPVGAVVARSASPVPLIWAP
jgi:diacylglycerol kinase (ATP)